MRGGFRQINLDPTETNTKKKSKNRVYSTSRALLAFLFHAIYPLKMCSQKEESRNLRSERPRSLGDGMVCVGIMGSVTGEGGGGAMYVEILTD